MKPSIARRIALPLALASALLPLTIIGCGGGSGNGPNTPQATATPSPMTPVALIPTTFVLANGQRITLTGTRTGNQLTGTLAVAASAAQTKLATGAQNATFPFQIAAGEYAYTGTITPPFGFNVAGNFGALGNFTLIGQLPTETENGGYSLTTNGVTDSGILPAPNAPTSTATPAPTNTPAPTATPIPTGFRLTVPTPLTFSDVTAGSAISSGTISSLVTTASNGIYRKVSSAASSGSYEQISVTGRNGFRINTPGGSGNDGGTSRTLSVAVASAPDTQIANARPFVNGQQIDLTPVDASTVVQLSQITGPVMRPTTRVWRAISGTAIVRGLGTDAATIDLRNVRMSRSGTDEFTLNGTIAAVSLTIQNN